MRAVIIFSLSVIFFQAKAWSPIRSSFDLTSPHKKFHTITECVHVTTEDGDFYFKKNPHILSPNLRNGINIVDATSPMTVCGLYFITDPDKIIEISIKHLDVDCETDGLMAFVDGWEWNGQYFPSEKDHTLNLDRRVTEFCSESSKWSMRTQRRIYISSQNAALLQYRIPVRGSFIANVRYLENPTPCNIMVDGLAPFYTLKNFGKKNNCTLIAMYPAAISIIGMNIGNNYEEPNYDCEQPNALDRLEIGGAPGIDTTNMEKSTTVCGTAEKPGPEQSIFCEVASIRLVSSGLHNNYAKVSVRQATENDFASATLFCGV